MITEESLTLKDVTDKLEQAEMAKWDENISQDFKEGYLAGLKISLAIFGAYRRVKESDI